MKAEHVPYWKKLLDPRWQKKRLEVLDRDEFTCRNCCEPDKTLHVHHLLYRKGAQPWEYEDHELITLCDECHKAEEEYRDELLSLLGLAAPCPPLSGLLEAVRVVLCRDSFGLWDWYHTADYPDLIAEATRRVRIRLGHHHEDYSI